MRNVRHKISDIVTSVYFAKLSNINDWDLIRIFGKKHEGFLRKYLELGYLHMILSKEFL